LAVLSFLFPLRVALYIGEFKGNKALQYLLTTVTKVRVLQDRIPGILFRPQGKKMKHEMHKK